MLIKNLLITDIDGVMHRGSLPAKWHNIVVKLLSQENDLDYKKYLSVRRLYRQGLATSKDHSSSFLNSWMKIIKNLPLSIVYNAIEELMITEGFDNFIFPRELITLAKKKGYFTLGISRCPQIILDVYNYKFGGLDLVIGSSLVVEDLYLTGETSNSQIFHDKKSILEDFFVDRNITPSNKSICIGDTSKDIEWMEIIPNQIVFNADTELILYANEKAWLEVHEHKDIVRCFQFPNIISPKELAYYLLT